MVEGKRLYGRGACDMKGGLAALVGALLAVKRALGKPPRPLRLAALADEEGMMLGVKAFVKAGLARGFRGPWWPSPRRWRSASGRRGPPPPPPLPREDGPRGHALRRGEPHPQGGPLRPGAKGGGKAPAGALPPPLPGAPYLTPTRFLATAGEGQLNVIPAEAEVALDVRTTPGVDHAGLVAELAALAGAGVEVLEDRPPVETPKEDSLVQAAEEALRLLGLPVKHGGVPGATDGTFLRAWAGLPVVVMGPGRKTLPHQVDEWVDLEEVVQAARVYAALAVLYLE